MRRLGSDIQYFLIFASRAHFTRRRRAAEGATGAYRRFSTETRNDGGLLAYSFSTEEIIELLRCGAQLAFATELLISIDVCEVIIRRDGGQSRISSPPSLRFRCESLFRAAICLLTARRDGDTPAATSRSKGSETIKFLRRH